MIRNQYNQIPHPVLDTKWERDTYKWKAKGADGHKAILNEQYVRDEQIVDEHGQLE